MSLFNCIFHYIQRIFCCCDCCDCFRTKKLDKNDVEGIVNYMKTCKNIIVMTGAGISTNAKIPDFRSESFGLYNKLAKFNLPYPEAVFDLNYFKRDPRPFYKVAHELYPVIAEARPTITHYFIKLLNDKGILLKHYTQNIDGLENETGLSQDKTIQAHGHIRSGTCLNCKKQFSFDYMKKFVIEDNIPVCDSCNSTIKPDIVLFNEGLPNGFKQSLFDFPNCDLLIIIGTSLTVQPFAGLAGKVSYNTPRLLINRDKVGNPNMFGNFATSVLGLNPHFDADSKKGRDVFYQIDCDQGCLELVRLLGWEDDLNKLIIEGNKNIDLNRN